MVDENQGFLVTSRIQFHWLKMCQNKKMTIICLFVLPHADQSDSRYGQDPAHQKCHLD